MENNPIKDEDRADLSIMEEDHSKFKQLKIHFSLACTSMLIR